jgi:predicted DNA-binding transcriptional regulator AlpA
VRQSNARAVRVNGMTNIERAILLLVENGYAVYRVPTPPQQERGDAAQGVYSIKEFCARYDTSRTAFYRLQREGRGPRLMKVGRRTVISHEAAQEWAQSMEASRG